MEILPEKIQEIIDEHESLIKKQFSEQIFTELVIRNHKHLLVMLSEHLDLGEIERECRDFHHQEGPGKAPTHTVNKMVAALMVGWLYGCSLRDHHHGVSADDVAPNTYAAFKRIETHRSIR